MNLNQIYTLIASNKYIQAIIVLVLFYIAAKIIIVVLEKNLLRITAKTKTTVDNLIIKRVK